MEHRDGSAATAAIVRVVTYPSAPTTKDTPGAALGLESYIWDITLEALEQTNRSVKASVKPEDYSFVQFHLNAELHFNNARAQLGWSMRHAIIVVENAALARQ